MRSDTPDRLIMSGKNVRYPINFKDAIGWTDCAFGSEHPGGAQFALADGSTRFFAETIEHAVYLSLASRNGREPVQF